ncbi:MAG: FecR family protein [Ginsengibacter sp.]
MQDTRNTQNFKELLHRYKNGTCTPADVKNLFEFIKAEDADPLIDEELRKEFKLMFDIGEQTEKLTTKVFRLRSLRKYAVVAAASVIILFALYFFLGTGNSGNYNNELVGNGVENVPVQKYVVLTMDNGKKFKLDSASVGEIAVQSGIVISLNESGELLYDASKAHNEEKIRNNTVSTPSGGFFKIVLPDGTKVWLNSESELTFPSNFEGKERSIFLKGEGYFEVAENKGNPFKVNLDRGEEIAVLGTIFNIMAYKNEPVKKITLLEGSIRLSNKDKSKILKPGQLAVIANGQIEVNNNVAIEHEIAWKNGLFDFQNDDLYTIMRQISRWYNMEIIYNESNLNGHFTGSMRKSADIREVIKMLEVAGDLSFSIVGNKILVNEKK